MGNANPVPRFIPEPAEFEISDQERERFMRAGCDSTSYGAIKLRSIIMGPMPMEPRPPWLIRQENGAIAEARTRAFLMDRFWVLERSADVPDRRAGGKL